jgi:hypothetical protein
MVFISSTKYACETCIKGHRSSNCKHTDRPLFEIKKKGRPVTQCEHCRELRRTKQVHVKCICESRDDTAKPSEPKKIAPTKNAAFPNGLPEAMEMSIALQLPPDGVSSDSDHGVLISFSLFQGMLNFSAAPDCTCKSGGTCICFAYRKNAPKIHKKTKADLRRHHSDDGEELFPFSLGVLDAPQTSSHVRARIAELRPVLPKPFAIGPLHDPSSGIAHGHSSQHHTHENMVFSPYGRAYEYTHGSDHGRHNDARASVKSHPHSNPSQPSPPINEGMSREGVLPTIPTWKSPVEPPCSCDDLCGCPNCVFHRGQAAFSVSATEALNSCTNSSPCVERTISSVPEPQIPNVTSSKYGAYLSVDDWMRLFLPIDSSDDMLGNDLGSISYSWETFQFPSVIEAAPKPQLTVCQNYGMSCMCPPGFCKCGGTGNLMFTVSQECTQFPSNGILVAGGDTIYPDPNADTNGNGYFIVPQRTRSRSSSTSSSSGDGHTMTAYPPNLQGLTLNVPFNSSPFPSSPTNFRPQWS